MASWEIVALNTTTPQLMAPQTGDTYAIPRNVIIASGITLSWNSDVVLNRDAANTLALRNGTSAQVFHLYSTYTDASNYERLRLVSSGTSFSVFTEALGTGTNRPLRFGASGGTQWEIDTSGHFISRSTNTYDIGTSTTVAAPRNIFAGSGITAGGNIYSNGGDLVVSDTKAMYWTNRSFLKSPSDGAFQVLNYAQTQSFTITAGASNLATFNGDVKANRFNLGNGSQIADVSDGVVRLSTAAGTDFGRLNFGPATSSFPAIKRSSATLQARLADDSAFAFIQGKHQTDTNYTAGALVPTGYITLYDATGTAYRVPCLV
jgi:hypothetical protein